MYRYILKRLVAMIPILLCASFIVYGLMALTPGEPARIILGEAATQEAVDKLSEEFGFDQPFLVRYGNFLKDLLLKFDFGTSYRTRQPVMDEIAKRAPVSLQLAQACGCVVVAKGYQTLTVTPEGKIYINTTGNAGLARAGSGDLLTGMAGALLAQGLSAEDAALCAVWLHGAAADRCAARLSQTAMLGQDMLVDLGTIFLEHQR